MNKQVFKPYTPKQALMPPPDLGDLISEGHLVRVVDEIIKRLDIKLLKRQYKGGRTSTFHP